MANKSFKSIDKPRRPDPPRRPEVLSPGKSYKFGHLDITDTWVIEEQIETKNRHRLIILAVCVALILTLLIWH